MEHVTVRKLADTQLQAFADNDYVTPELFDGIVSAIDADFPDGRFSFADIGGGRGLFADRLLARFPGAECTVIDNSEMLLTLNLRDPRKRLVLTSATDLADRFPHGEFDIAFFNLSLHHFVAGTYSETRKLQRYALRQALRVLSPRGRIVVTENLFEGLLADNLPGFLVYALTSSSALAPLVKRLGANTAGCGVCFHSAQAWRNEFRRLHLRELRFGAQLWRESEFKRRFCLGLLGVRSVHRGFFWLAP
jgi:SAM-dependent methyltransferase